MKILKTNEQILHIKNRKKSNSINLKAEEMINIRVEINGIEKDVVNETKSQKLFFEIKILLK